MEFDRLTASSSEKLTENEYLIIEFQQRNNMKLVATSTQVLGLQCSYK
jgi:hypothetical protein